MPAHRKLPDNDMLLQLLRQGWTHRQIADEYGVTTQAVFAAVRLIPGATKPRPTYSDELPWTLAAEHRHARPAALLRHLGRRNANLAAGREPNAGLSDSKAATLDRWLERMQADGLVVVYDRRIPPNPASPEHGGFAYVRRTADDDPNSLVRRPAKDSAPGAETDPKDELPETVRVAMPTHAHMALAGL
jgi:hypothetical protein